MPPRRRSPVPTPIDVEAVRRKLDEGKIVRVGISKSAQFPDGGTGRVRRVGRPETDGDEYVQVELSLNGTRDVLPFTPGDLTPATRAKAAPDPEQGRPPRIANRDPRSATTGLAPRESEASAQPSEGASGDVGAADLDRATARHGASSAPIPSATTSSKGTRAGKGGKKSPPVTITIATTDTDPPQWRIEAKVGARVVLRSASVTPARVWELVQQLDEDTLTTTVGGILEEQRRSAQARADALAEELARVRAELEALPDGRR